jgi:hypothetical protein
MIRITFVVGAGKLSRQKYDASAMVILTNALKQLDYVEDRGASCLVECGGCYKTQHDTGKNLYTVVVFPRISVDVVVVGGREANNERNAGDARCSSTYPIPIPLVEGTATHTILASSEETFASTISSICPSWSEKKMCSEVLNLAIETVRAIDERLLSGTALDDDEQEFYDMVGGTASICTKVEYVRKLMIEQVENGPLTRMEIDRLLGQVEERIASLDADIDVATRDSMEKKATVLTVQRGRAVARRVMLAGREARPPRALKHEVRIMELRKNLRPILEMEKTITRGKLLSIKETRELSIKDELLSEISELETASRGLFEEDDAFEERLVASRNRKVSPSSAKKPGGSAKSAPGGKGKSPGTGSRSASGGGGSAWQTPGGSAAGRAALGGMNSTTGKSKPKSGGGVFAAMMIDSDSDSDSD